MGKSDKKVKPDRIVALRKQYEEFLEEDKKRKERNDFILGRLDKMRSNSLVPVKQAETPQERYLYRPAPIYQGSILNKPQGNELQNIGNQQNIPANLRRSALLEEIGKKYILIPRSSAVLTEYNEKGKVTDFTTEKENNDWKSKYHILDELKRADKEGLEPNSENDHFPNKEHQHNFVSPYTDALVQKTGNDQEPALKYKEEVQEKELLYKQSDYGIHNYPEKPLDNFENKKYAIQNNDQDTEIPVNTCPERLYETQNVAEKEIESGKPVNKFMPLYSSQTELGYRVTEVNKNLKHESATQDNHTLNPTNTFDAAECNTFREATAIVENEKANIDNAGFQDIDNPHVTFETYNSHKGKDKDSQNVDYAVENQSIVQNVNQNIVKDEEYQYPIEAINTQEFTPTEGVILKEGVNINPDGYTLTENYVNPSIAYLPDSQLATDQIVAEPEFATETAPQPAPIEESEIPETVNDEDTKEPVIQKFVTEQIQEFEEEQANMFYQEPDAAYDQTTGDADYASNQNEPYQYYEGVEQEQYNPVEINEHEEANERYDPSYQGQYAQGEYDYTQQGYEQPGYEQQGYAEQQQEYGQSVQEYTAPQQYPQQDEETYDVPQEQGYDIQAVEQQLDHDRNYIETEHEVTESEVVEQEQQEQQNS